MVDYIDFKRAANYIRVKGETTEEESRKADGLLPICSSVNTN